MRIEQLIFHPLLKKAEDKYGENKQENCFC